MPVDENVAEIFWPISPLLPMPVTTTRPAQQKSSSTARSNASPTRGASSRIARASISSTRRAVSRDIAAC